MPPPVWDYIIVGAGSAGCAAAYYLGQSGRARILVLEAGDVDTSLTIKVPGLVGEALKRFDWGYVSQPDESRHGRTENWLKGRVRGGSSSINGTVFVRGAAHDYDRWANVTDQSWSFRELLPLFRDMERADQEGDFRRGSGPLSVSTTAGAHPLTKAFLQSAAAAGHRANPDYNAESQDGVGLVQVSQRNGVRCSAADAFLAPLRKSENVAVRLNTLARELIWENGEIAGVSISCNGVIREERAHRVIICAGAIETPKLLMLSGIGDAQTLAQHGIQVRVHSPEVGKNLIEHPTVRMVYRSTIASYNPTSAWRKVGAALRYAAQRQGVLANLFEGIAFLRTSAREAHPDVQALFLPLGADKEPNQPLTVLPYPSFSIILNKSHPVARGEVRLAGARPEEHPIIAPRLLESEDVATLSRGVQAIREIMAQNPIASFIVEEVRPGASVQSSEALADYLRARVGPSYHCAGTCRMGADSASVVDERLRVRGVANLWVADASVMPSLISGNTNAAAMMIGAKLGRELCDQ